MARAEAERTLWGVATLRTLRAHWALAELDLSYETRPVQSRSGETQTADFLGRINPRGKIPVLVDGDLTVAESGAILNYLADRYGTAQRFAPPPGTPERALHDQWCFFAATELDATSLYILRRHDDLQEIYGAAPQATRSAREYFDRQVRVVAEAIADGRPHLLGDTLTAADIMMTTVLDWAEYCGIELLEPLVAYRTRHRGRAAYRHATAKNRAPKP